MKTLLLGLFFSVSAWAKPTVLISYFDPFGRASINNSETVAKLISQRSKELGANFEVKLCRVETKFDVSFDQLRNCLNKLPEAPALVLGLGETGCDLKIEIMARNNDRTYGPDNQGVERRNTPIVRNAPQALGMTFPLDEMYCAVDEADRKKIIISNNAGSFVCNNLAYQTLWHERGVNFGFIHVPTATCRNVNQKNETIVKSLMSMIAKSSSAGPVAPLPVTKPEISARRNEVRDNKCLSDFWKTARPF